MNHIKDKLSGGDLRSIGNSNEVAKDILQDQSLFKEVFYCMLSDDPVIRMRSADVIEKVSRECPDFLMPYKKILIKDIISISQQEVRWHVAQMLSNIRLNKKEKDRIVPILFNWLDTEKSNIVKVNALQTLANILDHSDEKREKLIKKLRNILKDGSPSMKARAEKILKKMRN